MTAAQALAEHGMPPERLLGFARQIASRHHRRDLGHADRGEDLVSFLVVKGLEYAMRWDPSLGSGGYTFDSYLYDIMERRVPDFFRRQSEGYADHRKGRPGQPRQFHQVLDRDDVRTLADADIDELENVATTQRLVRYREAAEAAGVPLGKWVRAALDAAADRSDASLSARGGAGGRPAGLSRPAAFSRSAD